MAEKNPRREKKGAERSINLRDKKKESDNDGQKRKRRRTYDSGEGGAIMVAQKQRLQRF